MNHTTTISTRMQKARIENSSSCSLKTEGSHSLSSTPEKILFLQRTIGNQIVQRLITSNVLQSRLKPHSIQLKPGPDIDMETIEWEKGVDAAEKAAKNKETQAEEYYKVLIVRAAKKITAPSPLIDKKPDKKDIKWSKTETGEWSAVTDPGLVDDFPDDYWKWLTFNPGAVKKDEAWTVSAIFHELDHAAHARTLYDEWKKTKKPKWDDFWVGHLGKWTEPAIKVGANAGVIGVLEGLPKTIQPSAIEFKAYSDQFINFFHKLSIDKQSLLAKAVILFYPLKKQKVKESITDPSLDVAAARKQILDYFNSPSLKGEEQKDILKIRIATEFKAAVLFFRPAGDMDRIKKDFADIFDYNVSPEEMKDARRKYKPEQ